MEHMPYSQIQKGTLLVATPEIDMGLFSRSVVLVCEHNPSGSFGLVINKNLNIELPEEILNPENVSNPYVDIRAGGPVQTNQMMLLHTSDTIPHQTLQICDGVYLGGDLQFLHDTVANNAGPQIHLCFGYAGWGAGQLEREFLDGHWFVFPASARHIFNVSADRLWPTVLREMGGRYATLSMIPEDLSLN
jgi:putative transcriptional regulator